MFKLLSAALGHSHVAARSSASSRQKVRSLLQATTPLLSRPMLQRVASIKRRHMSLQLFMSMHLLPPPSPSPPCAFKPLLKLLQNSSGGSRDYRFVSLPPTSVGWYYLATLSLFIFSDNFLHRPLPILPRERGNSRRSLDGYKKNYTHSEIGFEIHCSRSPRTGTSHGVQLSSGVV